jgi:predicted component of type VI protein secretion system
MIVKLLVVQGRPVGKTLHFAPGDYFLGRGPECAIRFKSDWVSRQHCLLRVTADEVRLRDLASRNGTLVNGQLCKEEQILADGDLVSVGPLVFRIRIDPDEPETGPPVPDAPLTLQPEDEEAKPKAAGQDSTALHPTLPDSPPEPK